MFQSSSTLTVFRNHRRRLLGSADATIHWFDPFMTQADGTIGYSFWCTGMSNFLFYSKRKNNPKIYSFVQRKGKKRILIFLCTCIEKKEKKIFLVSWKSNFVFLPWKMNCISCQKRQDLWFFVSFNKNIKELWEHVRISGRKLCMLAPPTFLW